MVLSQPWNSTVTETELPDPNGSQFSPYAHMVIHDTRKANNFVHLINFTRTKSGEYHDQYKCRNHKEVYSWHCPRHHYYFSILENIYLKNSIITRTVSHTAKYI